jgi:DNA repair photolyase
MGTESPLRHPKIGRGAISNPGNRFEKLHYEPKPGMDVDQPDETPSVRTIFFRDASKSIISRNDSPDVGFNASVNPYRGCEHGCIYCYARPTHEYLGFSAGIDFESRIMVKTGAPQLLREELARATWKPQVLAMSGVTDCYQPAERTFKLTRACLEVLAEFRNPTVIVTKNHLVTRDIDVLAQLAKHDAAAVFVSVTTMDSELARKLEPRTSLPEHRLDAIRKLAAAKIPVGVLVAPVIPVLTESEMPAILSAAREAGASFAGFGVLRLPFGVKDLFSEWLGAHFPGSADAVLNRIREIRGGRLNDSDFGNRMRGQGIYAEQIKQVFSVCSRRLGFSKGPRLSTEHFVRPPDPQLLLFGDR